MKKLLVFIILACWPLSLMGQEIVEKIEIEGNDRVSRETILYYLSSKEGGYFDQEQLRRDFKILWSTGFFSNIKMEDTPGESGKILKIIVEENPIIKDIVFKTGKKLKEDDIVTKLKEKDEHILPYSYYSPHRIQKVQETIKGLLDEKGLVKAKVQVETNKKGENELEIVFRIDEGPKVKVGEIVFEGNPKVRHSVLAGALKENRKHNLFTWITGKDSFKENKLSEDLVSLKRKLQELGYMEASIGEPRVEEIQKRSVFFKKQPMKKIFIPVNAGYRYFVGDVTIEGNKIISAQALRRLIKLNDGDAYSTKMREKAVEDIGELYRNGGYIYAQIIPVENLDPNGKRVNVTFNIYEGEPAYLHRLSFKGNTYTKEKVMRRELLLREGDRFSFSLFKDSLLRMKQVGLVDLEKDPDIQPDPENPQLLDVTVHVKELQRNNIQFTAGYSGYEGTFVAVSYSTVNFLGAGENLQLMFQYGKRVRNYTFGFTEPYIFDLPITLGFNLFDRYTLYPYLFSQKSRGVDLQFGARVKGYWRTGVTYSYQNMRVDETTEEESEGFLDPYYYSYGSGFTGGYSPYYYGTGYGYGRYNVSSITTSLYRNTVDSPLTPSRGTLYLASVKFAGGLLGGDVTLIRPRFEWTFFHPVIKSHVFGLHMEYQFTQPFGESAVPFWERIYLGGERSIRGYDIYTIGPRSEEGRNLGGEKSLVFNAEYIIPIGGPVYAIFFYDAGNAYARDQKINLRNLFSSAGLEMRIFVPALRVPFRLIFSYNNRRIYADDSNFAFRFAIGTTF
jgi:outer membrane protein insertion porin family